MQGKIMNQRITFRTKLLSLILLSLSCKLHSMNNDPKKGLYPHNYACTKHHYKNRYPIIRDLGAEAKFLEVTLTEEEDRNVDQYLDGKAPLVVPFIGYNVNQELAASKQIIDQETVRLVTGLGRPAHNGQFLPVRDNANGRALTQRLQNQPEEQIKQWEARLNEFPALWQELEKTTLNANIFNNIKFGHSKAALLRVFAKGLDAAVWAYSIPFVDILDEKNATIAQRDASILQEQAAKEALRLQKDGIIAQRDASILQKDATIAEKETLANNHLQSYNLSVRREHGLRDDLASERASAELIQADRDQIETDFIALLNLSDTTAEIHKKRISGLDEQLKKTNQELEQRRALSPLRRQQFMAVEEENARLRAQLEALRKQTLDQGSKAADEYANLRRELSPLRKERDKLKSDLEKAQPAVTHIQGCPILKATTPY